MKTKQKTRKKVVKAWAITKSHEGPGGSSIVRSHNDHMYVFATHRFAKTWLGIANEYSKIIPVEISYSLPAKPKKRK